MIELDGKLYDGTSSRAAPVAVQLFEDGQLHVEGGGRSVVLLAASLRISERLGRAPRWVELGNDARVELPDSDELERWLRRQRSQQSGWLAALEARWVAVVASAAVTLAIGFAAVQFGVPALASLVARALPASVDRELGEGVLETFDQSMFEASELSDARRSELTALFERLESYAHLVRDARLEFRKGDSLGANAFALPNGVVVMTDELVALAEDDAEIAAVLAHELGHVKHRHSLRAVLQSAGIGVLIAGALGDFVSISSLAGTLPALLVQLQYSRSFELEADAFSQRVMSDAELDRDALGRMLARLEEAHAGASVPAYLSSHPATEERVRALRDGR